MSFVYFIRSGEFVKIGLSRQPDRRRAEMDAYCPIRPQLVATLEGSRFLEHRIHFLLRHLHVRREWFRWAPEIALLIEGGIPSTDSLPSARDIRLTRESLGMVHLKRRAVESVRASCLYPPACT